MLRLVLRQAWFITSGSCQGAGCALWPKPAQEWCVTTTVSANLNGFYQTSFSKKMSFRGQTCLLLFCSQAKCGQSNSCFLLMSGFFYTSVSQSLPRKFRFCYHTLTWRSSREHLLQLGSLLCPRLWWFPYPAPLQSENRATTSVWAPLAWCTAAWIFPVQFRSQNEA